MERDVYAKLVAKLKEFKDYLTGVTEKIATKTEYTGTVPAEGACSVEVGTLATVKGWQWLVETSSGVWSDVNQWTYFLTDSIYLYVSGDQSVYRGKDYRLIVYTLEEQEDAGT